MRPAAPRPPGAAVVLGAAMLGACGGVELAEPLRIPVVTDVAGMESMVTDLGWEVTIERARLAVADLRLTVGDGPTARRPAFRPWDLLVPSAWAHPGHGSSGEIMGELLGRFLIDATAPVPLGTASLYPGTYRGLSFSFRPADRGDGLAQDDPLLGHGAHLAGTATRDEHTVPFEVLLELGTALVEDAPFRADVTRDGPAGAIHLQWLATDELEGDTLLDGVNFDAADSDQDGRVQIRPGDPLHDVVRRRFLEHDHYAGRWVPL